MPFQVKMLSKILGKYGTSSYSISTNFVFLADSKMTFKALFINENNAEKIDGLKPFNS